MADNELSIEETNKIRLSLGLKPLKVDNAPTVDAVTGEKTYDDTTEGRERRAVDNWKEHQAQLEKEESRRRRADDIRRAREAAQRFRMLEGKGLADEHGDAGADATTWVKKMKKRQKKLAENMEREREEELQREAELRKEYTEKDLKGVRVAHDLGDIEGETILTLKDATIDENEEDGDELISTDLTERERLRERLDLKKKKPVYNAYDDEESGEKRLLAQYDDDDDKKKKRFVLDGTGSLANRDTYRQEVAEKLKSVAFSLDMPKPEVTSDYVDPATIKVKKPKKKKKSTRKRSGDDEDALNPGIADQSPDAPESMELDDAPVVAPISRKRSADDASFVDDDDLQSLLTLQRRTALKKRKLLKPADIAQQLREESEHPPSDNDEEPGLVIDETSEFVATLRETARPRPKFRAAPTAEPEIEPEASPEPDEDVDMIRDERDERDKPSPTTPAQPEISSTGLEEETTITRGVGATLAMLNQRGLLKRDPDAERKAALQRDRERFRLQKRLREAEAEDKAKQARLRDRQSGKFDRMSAREREEHARWENKQRDLQEAKEMAQRFKDYKPDVELHYKDEFGREMGQKEAFKYLSHQFHGKGSGKAKTEKRLKKIEDEKKREAASQLSATGQEEDKIKTAAKRSKQAGVRLM